MSLRRSKRASKSYGTYTEYIPHEWKLSSQVVNVVMLIFCSWFDLSTYYLHVLTVSPGAQTFNVLEVATLHSKWFLNMWLYPWIYYQWIWGIRPHSFSRGRVYRRILSTKKKILYSHPRIHEDPYQQRLPADRERCRLESRSRLRPQLLKATIAAISPGDR